jgi:septal ring factor EnvC (AmiA/AmiB activator)
MAGVLPFSQAILKDMMNSSTSNHFPGRSKGSGKKSWLFITIGVMFTPALIVLTFQAGISFSSPTDEIGIITANNLNMRPEPGMTAPPLMVLKQGTEVKIIKQEGQWLKIIYEGQTGYIQNRERYVHIISPNDTRTGENLEKTTSVADRRIERYKKEAQKIGGKIEEEEARLQHITRNELNILGNLDHLDLSLFKARKRISSNKVELAVLEKKIANITERHKNLTKEVATKEDYASQRLVALYKLNLLGKVNLLASATSMHELFQRKTNLERILAQDEQIREKLLADKARLKNHLDLLNTQQMKKRTLQASIKKQIREVSWKRSERTQLLEKIRSERSLQVASLESLKQAAVALDQTIDSLEAEFDPTAQVRNLDIVPFSEFKGLLKMPVKGKIISLFGSYKNPKFNVTNFRSGIDIKAENGARVQAVYAGHILYASWFKGYGNVIIIDHGDSYYTVYAHLEDLLIITGDFINAGDDIATVGDTGSMMGPKLYFEVRHHGKPLDPLKWIIKG